MIALYLRHKLSLKQAAALSLALPFSLCLSPFFSHVPSVPPLSPSLSVHLHSCALPKVSHYLRNQIDLKLLRSNRGWREGRRKWHKESGDRSGEGRVGDAVKLKKLGLALVLTLFIGCSTICVCKLNLSN